MGEISNRSFGMTLQKLDLHLIMISVVQSKDADIGLDRDSHDEARTR